MKDAVADAFYLVWREDGGGPRVKHASYHAAAKEAQRLARNSPGDKFVVLQSVRGFQVTDMQVTEYEQEIPF